VYKRFSTKGVPCNVSLHKSLSNVHLCWNEQYICQIKKKLHLIMQYYELFKRNQDLLILLKCNIIINMAITSDIVWKYSMQHGSWSCRHALASQVTCCRTPTPSLTPTRTHHTPIPPHSVLCRSQIATSLSPCRVVAVGLRPDGVANSSARCLKVVFVVFLRNKVILKGYRREIFKNILFISFFQFQLVVPWLRWHAIVTLLTTQYS